MRSSTTRNIASYTKHEGEGLKTCVVESLNIEAEALRRDEKMLRTDVKRSFKGIILK